MRLLPTSEFATRLASPYTGTELATSELLVNSKPTGLIVTGAVLEAALEWQGCRIAFLTDEILFEDMLRIYMFDANMVLIEFKFFRHFRIEGKPQPDGGHTNEKQKAKELESLLQDGLSSEESARSSINGNLANPSAHHSCVSASHRRWP